MRNPTFGLQAEELIATTLDFRNACLAGHGLLSSSYHPSGKNYPKTTPDSILTGRLTPTCSARVHATSKL